MARTTPSQVPSLLKLDKANGRLPQVYQESELFAAIQAKFDSYPAASYPLDLLPTVLLTKCQNLANALLSEGLACYLQSGSEIEADLTRLKSQHPRLVAACFDTETTDLVRAGAEVGLTVIAVSTDRLADSEPDYNVLDHLAKDATSFSYRLTVELRQLWEQRASPVVGEPVVGELLRSHLEHLHAEGFSFDEIDELRQSGVRSVSEVEARALNFIAKGADGQMQSGSGLYLPFNQNFAQLRLDSPIAREDGKAAKYLTPCGTGASAYYPPGAEFNTEGIKDARIAKFKSGIECAAVAGVTHIPKALPAGCGLTTIFDSDGWTNPSVMVALVRAGVHLKGKINLLPEIPGQSKAGMCEFFKAGHTGEDLRQLLDEAFTPKEMLFEWAKRFVKVPTRLVSEALKKLMSLAAELLDHVEQNLLLKTLKTVLKQPIAELRALLTKAIQSLRERLCKESGKEIPRRIEWNHDDLALEVASKYQDKIIWDESIKEWRYYGSKHEGVWSIKSHHYIRKQIKEIIREISQQNRNPHTNQRPNISDGLMRSVEALLKDELLHEEWLDSDPRLIPFTNGVLNRETMEFQGHDSSHYLTWTLPYDYNREAKCDKIRQWLLEISCGDPQLVELFRAYLYSCVTGRTDWHSFLEMFGPGGAGKSTFINLAIALVGQQNTHSTDLKKLENVRFETAALKDKRLLVATDMENYMGQVGKLKAITGGDMVGFEKKNKDSKNGFHPTCKVIVAANEPIQSSDYTSGLGRRRIIVELPNQICESKQRTLLEFRPDGMRGEFVSEIPGLLNWVLELDAGKANKRLKDELKALTAAKGKHLITVNPIADWADSNLILDPEAKTYMGDLKKPGAEYLYSNYYDYCEKSNSKTISLRRYVGLLKDLLKSQLKLQSIKFRRDNKGSYVEGIKLRFNLNDVDIEPDTPLLITGKFTQDPPPDGSPPGGGAPPNGSPPGGVPPDGSPPGGGEPPPVDRQSPAGSSPDNLQTNDDAPGADAILKHISRTTVRIGWPTELIKPFLKDFFQVQLRSDLTWLTACKCTALLDAIYPQHPLDPEEPSQSAIKAFSHQLSRIGWTPQFLPKYFQVDSCQELNAYQVSALVSFFASLKSDVKTPEITTPPDSPDGSTAFSPTTASITEQLVEMVKAPEAPNWLRSCLGSPQESYITEPVEVQLATVEPTAIQPIEEEPESPTPVLAVEVLQRSPVTQVRPDQHELPTPVEAVILDPDTADYGQHLEALSQAELISLDIETFGQNKNDGLHPWKGAIRLIQLCVGSTTYILDLGSRLDSRDHIRASLARALEVVTTAIANPEQKIIGHNLHFDLRFLATQLGMRNISNVACTMLGLKVFYGDYGGDSGNPVFQGGYSLENAARRLLGRALDKSQQNSDWGANLVPAQIEYAATDASVTFEVYQALEALYADRQHSLYSPTIREIWDVENAVLAPTIDIELTGMPVDMTSLKQQLDQITQLKQQLLTQWRELCPNVTYTQRDKLLAFLKSRYQLTLKKLDKASCSQHKDNPLLRLRLEITALDSLANNLKNFQNAGKDTGRVRTVYKTLTGFGRFSAGGGNKAKDLPNLQSVSSKPNPALAKYNLPLVRKVIRPPAGRGMAVIDLSRAHARIASDVSQDEVSIAGQNDDRIDNHSKVAVFIARALGLDWTFEHISVARKDKSHPDYAQANMLRNTAKNTYYGWLNGGGAERIQKQITANTGSEPELKACEAAIEGCKSLYPKVLEYRKSLMKHLMRTAVRIDDRLLAVNSLSDGSRILLPLCPSKWHPGELEVPFTQALASIWTRIEATAMKRALPKIQALSKANPQWALKMINYVHDEIDIEFDNRFAQEAVTSVNNLIGDEFQAQLTSVKDGRETDWQNLLVESWADK